MKRRIARQNDALVSEYHDRMRMWKTMKAAHEAKEQRRRDLVQVKLVSDAEAMIVFLNNGSSRFSGHGKPLLQSKSQRIINPSLLM